MVRAHDIDAFAAFRIGQICRVAPWKVRKEPMCEWWVNRILVFETAHLWAQEHLRKK